MTAGSETPNSPHPLVATVHDRFGGILTKGVHAPEGAACLNEALNAALGLPWSDDPHDGPDLRSPNDAPWSSDEQRTEHMLSIGVAVLWDWSSWSSERLASFAHRVAEATNKVIVPMALGAAPNAERTAARAARAGTAATRAAARAVESAAAAGPGSAAPAATESAVRAWSASAADWSAKAAVAAAWSSKRAPGGSPDKPLIAICHILVEAAQATS